MADPMDKSFLLLAAIISIGSVVGWIGVGIWGAIQDGREQRRLTEIRADSHEEAKFVRLSGCLVSDDNIRLLINELVAQGTQEAHETAQRIASARLAGLELASARLARRFEHLFGRTFFQHAATIEEQYTAGDFTGEAHFVGGH